MSEKIAVLGELLDSLKNNVLRELLDRQEVYNNQKLLLDIFSENSVSKLSSQLSYGKLNVHQWKEAFDFLGSNTAELNDSIRIIDNKIKKVKIAIDKYKEDYKALCNTKSKKSYDVKIDFNVKYQGRVKIALEYIMPDASWQPIYNARLTKGKATMSCMADVKQSTGEDWENVELTLSSSDPFEEISPFAMIFMIRLSPLIFRLHIKIIPFINNQVANAFGPNVDSIIHLSC